MLRKRTTVVEIGESFNKIRAQRRALQSQFSSLLHPTTDKNVWEKTVAFCRKGTTSRRREPEGFNGVGWVQCFMCSKSVALS